MQLTFRGRKGSNLQSDNLQLWALFILLTFLNFRVEFQCPPLSESLEMSWNGMKDWMWHMCHLCNKNPGKKVSAFEQILLQKSTLGNITIVTWQFPFFQIIRCITSLQLEGRPVLPVTQCKRTLQGASTWHQIPLPEKFRIIFLPNYTYMS